MFFINISYSLLTLLLITFVALYFHLSRNFNYWKSRGIKGDRPIILFGTLWKLLYKSAHDLYYDNYRKYGKIYGQFIFDRPVLVVVDPELIHDIFIKDFNNFFDRVDDETGEVLSDRALENLRGDEWRKMRSIISPTFSTSKMRKMHPIFIECLKRLEDYLMESVLSKGLNDIDLHKLVANLTLDMIASSAFGTRVQVYDNENSDIFSVNVTKYRSSHRRSWRLYVYTLISSIFPNYVHRIQWQTCDPKVSDYFTSLVQTIKSQRKTVRVKHNDYLQLMIDAQNKNVTQDEEMDGQPIGSATQIKSDVSEEDFLANTLNFLTVGIDNIQGQITRAIGFLAVDAIRQQKLFEEVVKFGGDYTYETIAQMPYLDACIKETLRTRKRVSVLISPKRVAAEEYTLGDTGIKIPKGMLVNIDFDSIHHSPEYYPEPEKWIPERFMPENKDLLTAHTFLAFGSGPRNCVGLRLALIAIKTAVAHLVYRFRFYETTPTGAKRIGIELRNALK